jgi:hypothetical protein
MDANALTNWLTDMMEIPRDGSDEETATALIYSSPGSRYFLMEERLEWNVFAERMI